MNNIDEYLKNIVSNGYVYFVYSDVTNKIYVGESISKKRIDIYKSIINEDDDKVRIRLYKYYTKSNAINYELAGDMVNRNNNFKIIEIETKYHKHLEQTYIRFLYDKSYELYNSKLYKKHKYSDIELDKEIISLLINSLEPVKRKKLDC